MILQKLIDSNVISPPDAVRYGRTCYLTVTGSNSYGVSDNTSDIDVVGIVIPPKNILFPYTNGFIYGFGEQPVLFEQYEEFHVKHDKKEYDFTIYNITKAFDLAMRANPNMISYLFTPDRCVLLSTPIWEYIKENRKLFLSKLIKNKFIGYAYSQMKKIDEKKNFKNKKRQEWVNTYGYDLKFAYNLVRLLLEAEYIANNNDLDIECNAKILKEIRNGEWELDRVKDFFKTYMKIIDNSFEKTKLPDEPDKDKIKTVLTNCFQIQYGAFYE